MPFPSAIYGPLRDDETWKNLILQFRSNYKQYLENIGERTDDHYHHPGLNLRYGFELEFLASSNRYVIANRVNSCMYNQNDLWWRRNFNALEPVYPELNNGSKQITSESTNFNQWSSFFLEVSENHGAKSYKGHASCNNRGTAGFRIENDGSVELDDTGPGVSLYSVNKYDQHRNTDLKDKNTDVWNWDARGLRKTYVDINNNLVSDYCSSYTLQNGNTWNIDDDDETTLSLTEENELVSNILTNVHVNYANARYYNDDGSEYIDEGLLPLGGLAIDNIIHHMLSHKIAIATQDMGLHIHLSEFPRIDLFEERKQMIIGFVKLFYLFEPLFFSFFPAYRARSEYCQSLQSVFTRREIRDESYQKIWNDLVNGTNISGVNRKIKGMRYLSLNLQNCVKNGIQTIEVRLGHSTFDSVMLQAWVNVLQSLFRLNMSLIQGDDIYERDLYDTHNFLLSQDYVIPYYCDQYDNNYNNFRADQGQIHNNNKGAPIYGFFSHCGNSQHDMTYKAAILENLLELFIALTGAEDAISYLTPYTYEYHMVNDSWLSDVSTNVINFNNIFQSTRDKYKDDSYDLSFNDFIPVTQEEYAINNTGKYNKTHECKTCTKRPDNTCALDFNNGSYPDITDDERGHENDYQNDLRDESKIYSDGCDKSQQGKTQSELINDKLASNYIYNWSTEGGKRKKIRKTKKIKKSKKRKTIKKGGRIINPSNIVKLNSIKAKPIPQKRKMPNRLTNNSSEVAIKNSENINKDLSKVEDLEKLKREKELTVLQYRVNKGAEKINYKIQNGIFVVGYGDWLGGFTPDKRLTMIVNTLLKNKIINKETLDLLIKKRYIDYYVYMNESELHKKKLIQELGKLKISPEVIEKIRAVYKAFTKSNSY